MSGIHIPPGAPATRDPAGAGRLPASFLDELRERLTLSSVVGRRVKLVRAGREYKACCPFHNEKSPSFYVNDDKNFFHCFGCGAHGDVIAFTMRMQQAEFREAVEQLAAEAGLQVPRPAPGDAAADAARDRVLDCLEAAAATFAAALRGSPAERYAREERGLSDEEIATWRIGYAGGDVALTALRRAGFSAEDLLAAGLLGRRDDGTLYPFFRNRLVFPIRDARGRVRGFGARTMGPDQPKYLNSPASGTFDKGRIVYGADLARRRRRDARGQAEPGARLVVGEGYLDAIALTGLGFRGVSTNGTAMTEDHLSEAWRLDPEPVIAFDGDAAGIAAMMRVVERALPLVRADRALLFARMPAGEDPDSARRAGRGADVAAAVAAAIPLSQALYETCAQGLDLRVPEQRALCESRLRTGIGKITDPALRAAFESDLIYQGVRRLRVVEGGRARRPAPVALPLPDPGEAGRRMRLRLGQAIVRRVLLGGSVVEDMAEELAGLCGEIRGSGEAVPGLAEALRDPGAYAAGEAGAALLADAELAREFPFLRPGAGAIEIERSLRFAVDLHAADRLAAELVETVPASHDAPGWDAYLGKARALSEMRTRLALGEDE